MEFGSGARSAMSAGCDAATDPAPHDLLRAIAMNAQPWNLAAAAAVSLLIAACSSASGSGGKIDDAIGVVQCDEYLTKVAACINEKVPEAQRLQLRTDVSAEYATWKEATANPTHRAALPQACAIAQEQAKDEYARYGCAM